MLFLQGEDVKPNKCFVFTHSLGSICSGKRTTRFTQCLCFTSMRLLCDKENSPSFITIHISWLSSLCRISIQIKVLTTFVFFNLWSLCKNLKIMMWHYLIILKKYSEKLRRFGARRKVIWEILLMTFFSKFKFPLINNQPANVDEGAR